MLKTRKRWISLLLTLAMLVAFAVPFVGSASAGTAATYNTVTAAPKFDPDDGLTEDTAKVQVKFDPAIDTTSTVDIEVLDSEGAQLDITDVVYTPDSGYGVTAYSFAKVNDQRYTLRVTTAPSSDAKSWVNFALRIDAEDCAAGDIKINFFNPTGQLVDGSAVVATATGGAVTLAMVGTPPSLGSDSEAKKVTLRLNVQTSGAMDGGAHSIKIKLPAGFKWTSPGTGCDVDTNDDRVLWIAEKTSKNIYDLTAYIAVKDSDTAKYGDVVANVEGQGSTSVTPSSLTVATYADYGVDISVASVKTLVAGKYDQKTDKITIKEKITGTLINGRNITVKFPDWVKVEDIGTPDIDYANGTTYSVDPTSNKFTVTVRGATTSNKVKIEFKANLNIEAGNTGDLEATVSGAGIPESKVTVAKVVAPVTAEATATNVKIGVQDQAAPDITITESVAGAAVYTYNEWVETRTNSDGSITVVNATETRNGGQIVISLPSGAHFSGTPEATVTSGDLDIKDAKVEDSDTGTDDQLIIPIKSESLTASTIKITGVKLSLDRTVPEGPLTAKVGGSALVENNGDEDYQYNSSAAAKFTLAKCVTPADTTTTGTAVFKIGEASYTFNGTTVAMDAAPYIKDGRTFVPVRFAANAVGVTDTNILWDGAAGKVTVIKGDRVIQMTIGSNVMLINGAAVTMDAAPEIVNGRTMLPIRFLGQALGAEFAWDETAQTVTVTF